MRRRVIKADYASNTYLRWEKLKHLKVYCWFFVFAWACREAVFREWLVLRPLCTSYSYRLLPTERPLARRMRFSGRESES